MPASLAGAGVALLGLACLAASPAVVRCGEVTPSAFPIERHVLPNGLVVLLHEDHTVPSVTVWQWYRTGSRHERPGITGISHFLEHMMFNGSAHVAPDEFDRTLESHGGSANAFTDRDYTSYYEDVDARALDVVLRLDADRMAGLSLLPEQIERERAIVQEERRTRTENDADGQLDEALWRTAFTVSPYRLPVLGSAQDIARLTAAEMAAHFAGHSAPNACVLVLTGDFESADALRRIGETFGRVPPRAVAPDSLTPEPPQARERRVRVTYDGDTASFLAGYRAPGARDADTPALEVLAAILGGSRAARLPESLVRRTGIALDVAARQLLQRDPSLFVISVDLAPGVPPGRGVAALDSTVARLVREGPSPRELRAAVAQLELAFLQSLTTNNAAGEQIGFAEVVRGDYRTVYEMIPAWRAVTAAGVQRVARAVLAPSRRTVAELVPRGGRGR